MFVGHRSKIGPAPQEPNVCGFERGTRVLATKLTPSNIRLRWRRSSDDGSSYKHTAPLGPFYTFHL
jgi:hypothetical protein